MTNPCPGCGGKLPKPIAHNALSRYGHGYICSDCGLTEAMRSDFITRYFPKADADLNIYPIDLLFADNITA